MDLRQYVATRVDAHHTKLVHSSCGRETYVQHDHPTVGASVQALTDKAIEHDKGCR